MSVFKYIFIELIRLKLYHKQSTVNRRCYIYLIKMNEYEISKLKKELLRKNEVIKEMKDDLGHVEKQLVTVQAVK